MNAKLAPCKQLWSRRRGDGEKLFGSNRLFPPFPSATGLATAAANKLVDERCLLGGTLRSLRFDEKTAKDAEDRRVRTRITTYQRMYGAMKSGKHSEKYLDQISHKRIDPPALDPHTSLPRLLDG